MVRIVLAGQLRGNSESWNCIKAFKELHNARVYIASPFPEQWKLPFEFEIIQSEEYLADTVFKYCKDGSESPAKNAWDPDAYNGQWSALYSCWNFWNKNWNDADIVVKLRNDLVFEPFSLNPKNNTFHVPSKEFHATHNFRVDWICNDQLSYGFKDVMDKYFQLPYTFDWWYPRQPDVVNFYRYMGRDVYSIEEILRNHLYKQKLDIETFDLNYHKV